MLFCLRVERNVSQIVLLSAIILFLFFLSPFWAGRVQATSLQQHTPILIKGDAGFTLTNGVAGGDGSFLNPFVISNLNLTSVGGVAIEIRNTTAYFIIRDVFISHSNYGIMFFNVTNGEVSNSTLYQNSHGLFLLYSNDSIVFDNNFVGNTVQANDTGAVPNYNSWDNGYGGGGNYWSDYLGVDRCSGFNQNQCPDPDGIGDTCYRISGSSVSADCYPLMKPYYPDTTPPFWPTGSRLTAYHVTLTSLTLNWTLASDDTGVVSYRIFEGQILLGNVTANKSSFNVTGLTPATGYSFKIQAGDRADNWGDGPSVSISTPAQRPWYSNPAFWIGNWYFFVIPAVAVAVVVTIVLMSRMRKKRQSITTAYPNES